MSLSDINDRLMDGLGIISKNDALVYNAANTLQTLLRKINFPVSLNREFHDYLLERQKEYRMKLQTLIDTIEVGSKPVYYADLANQKYAKELKKLHVTISHEMLQATFVSKMRELFIDYDGYPSYIATLKDYKLRAKKLTGNRSDGKKLFYEEIGFHKLSDQEIIDKVYELTNEIFSHIYSQEEIEDFSYDIEPHTDNQETIVNIMKWEWLFHVEFILFKDRYNIMTRHKKLSNDKFRKNIEFIADIPVITKGRTAQMVKQLKFDKELIANFMKEKEELKHEKKKILSFVGKRLINFYRGKWMKDFIVPEL